MHPGVSRLRTAGDDQTVNASCQHLAYNRELFAFLSGEQVRIPHRHGDVLMAHELLQFHKRDLAGLGQPACEGMPHGMQGDSVQAVSVFRGQIELSDGDLETCGRLCKGCPLARLLEDGFHWSALIGLKHLNHVPGHANKNPLPTFLNDIEAAGVAVHILPAQFEDFRGTEAGSQREQRHIMQLRMPLFEIVQQDFRFFLGQEAQSFIVGLHHFPGATLGGQRVDSAPHARGGYAIDRGAHEAEDIIDSLPGQGFPLLRFGFGLSRSLLGFCVPGGSRQKLGLEVGKQIGGQIGNGQGVNFGLEVSAVLAVVLVNVLPFAPAPSQIVVHDHADGHFVALDGIDAGGFKFGKEFCPLGSGRGRTDALAVSADSFPMAFAFGVRVPEAVDFIVLSGAGIALGGLTEEDALELGLCVFSFSCVAHMSNIEDITREGKMLIQNLSKMDFQDKNLDDNYLFLLIILLYLLATCDRERERERERERIRPCVKTLL